MQITLMCLVTYVGVHKNVAFSDGEVLTFCYESRKLSGKYDFSVIR